MFKKRRGIKLSYEIQGLIYFNLLNYESQPVNFKRRVDKLCKEIGGDKWEALREHLITGKSIKSISGKYFISESVLYELRKNFYEEFYKKRR